MPSRRRIGNALVCRRTAEMLVRPPGSARSRCASCRHDVFVMPSGQKVLRDDKSFRVICNVCEPLFDFTAYAAAPGSDEERRQLDPRNN